jgi:hypothetical protein
MDLSIPEGLARQVSTYCNAGDCVQVAQAEKYVFLGDSKYPDGPALSYTHHGWREFITSIKNGHYDQV